MKKIINETFYSIEEVADLLELAPSTIRTYIKTDKLSAARIGKSLYVSKSNLKNFLSNSVKITRAKRGGTDDAK